MQCPLCGKTIEPNLQNICPECGNALSTAAAITMVAVPPPAASQLKPPAASIIPTDDAALLQRDNIQPPSRLGAIGRVGKFEIIKLLGRGGMAEVYLATEPITGTNVALKMLREELLSNPRIGKLFLAEARHMYELSHPGILKVLEISTPAEGAFFVMPFARGGSLDCKIGSDPLPLDDVIRMSNQIAEGLAYAHSKGLIHRDLKPANVLLDEEGRAMIADFGLVRPLFNDDLIDMRKTSPEGTPAYMSPAIAAGQVEDTRGDIYAFGAILYEMLAGYPPYIGKDPMSVLELVIAGPPSPLVTSTKLSSPGLVAIAQWCMARALRDRYASMDDVVSDLQLIHAGKSPRGPHDSGSGHWTRALMFGGIAALLITATAIGTYSFMARDRKPGPNAAPSESVTALVSKGKDVQETRHEGVASLTVLLSEAKKIRDRGDEAAAAVKYAAILTQYPLSIDALFELGMIKFTNGQRHAGTEHIRQAWELAPGNARINRELINILINIGHSAPALHTVDQWLETDPSNAEALTLRERIKNMEDGEGQPQGPPRTGGPSRRHSDSSSGESRSSRRRPPPPKPQHP
jgi:tRNA A-37 threonylcarbamoyl transferase component Bud32